MLVQNILILTNTTNLLSLFFFFLFFASSSSCACSIVVKPEPEIYIILYNDLPLQEDLRKSPKDHVFRKRTRQNARRESFWKSKDVKKQKKFIYFSYRVLRLVNAPKWLCLKTFLLLDFFVSCVYSTGASPLLRQIP